MTLYNDSSKKKKKEQKKKKREGYYYIFITASVNETLGLRCYCVRLMLTITPGLRNILLNEQNKKTFKSWTNPKSIQEFRSELFLFLY